MDGGQRRNLFVSNTDARSTSTDPEAQHGSTKSTTTTTWFCPAWAVILLAVLLVLSMIAVVALAVLLADATAKLAAGHELQKPPARRV